MSETSILDRVRPSLTDCDRRNMVLLGAAFPYFFVYPFDHL